MERCSRKYQRPGRGVSVAWQCWEDLYKARRLDQVVEDKLRFQWEVGGTRQGQKDHTKVWGDQFRVGGSTSLG